MRQFFRIIVEQADRIRVLKSDLLAVARIETGTLPVEPAPADVADLVDEARSAFVSGGGRNDILIDLAAGLPLVMADRQRTLQVLGNLLSNAARYSPESTPIVVSAERRDLHIAVSVTDRGRGVPDDRLPYLFRKYFRSDFPEQESSLSGSGLGLAISKGIVEAHGGRIWVDSEGLDMGTRFTFTMPVVVETGSGLAIGPHRPARAEANRVSSLSPVLDRPGRYSNRGTAQPLHPDPGGGQGWRAAAALHWPPDGDHQRRH